MDASLQHGSDLIGEWFLPKHFWLDSLDHFERENGEGKSCSTSLYGMILH
jgi:hypothetical protein